MRSLGFLILLVFGLTASAGDPPPELLRRLKAMRAPGVYILVAWSDRAPHEFLPSPGVIVEAPPALDQPWALANLAMSAELGRELRTLALGPLVQQVPGEMGPMAAVVQVPKLLQELLAWKPRRGWVLFDGRLRIVQESHVPEPPPTPTKVRSWMELEGWRWKREGLQAHLRKHPEDGQAHLELASDLLRQILALREARITLLPLLGELEDQLRLLGPLQDSALAWDAPPRPLLDLAELFQSEDTDRIESLRDPVEVLRRSLREALDRDPESASSWQLWLRTAPPGSTPDLVSAFEAVLPVPGRPFPSPNLEPLLRPGLAKEAARLATAARRWTEQALLHTDIPALPLLHSWGRFAFEAHLCAGQVQEALALVDWMHGLAGVGWKGLAATLRTLVEDAHGRVVALRITEAQTRTLLGALERAPLSLPPPARTRPLQVALLDPTRDALPWVQLQAHQLMDPWSPMELSWTPLDRDAGKRLRENRGSKDQAWVLLREGSVRNGGPGLPTAEVLAAAVAGEQTAILTRIESFVETHPERLDARREWVSRLRLRLPHPHHTETLLTLLAKEPWPLGALSIPFPESWGTVAADLCPRIAGGFSTWPFQALHWEAYADWSRYAPAALRPDAVLRDTATWPCLSGRTLPGPVPMSVALAVGRALRQDQRWEELRAWCEEIWGRGLRDWLRDAAWILHCDEDPPESWYTQQSAGIKELMVHWTAALKAQGKVKRLKDIRADLSSLDPVLIRLMD